MFLACPVTRWSLSQSRSDWRPSQGHPQSVSPSLPRACDGSLQKRNVMRTSYYMSGCVHCMVWSGEIIELWWRGLTCPGWGHVLGGFCDILTHHGVRGCPLRSTKHRPTITEESKRSHILFVIDLSKVLIGINSYMFISSVSSLKMTVSSQYWIWYNSIHLVKGPPPNVLAVTFPVL